MFLMKPTMVVLAGLILWSTAMAQQPSEDVYKRQHQRSLGCHRGIAAEAICSLFGPGSQTSLDLIFTNTAAGNSC